MAAFRRKIEEGFIFVGIMGMIDPPRSEVKDAIAICRQAGIRVVMITGDHELTATAVAKALNLHRRKRGRRQGSYRRQTRANV